MEENRTLPTVVRQAVEEALSARFAGRVQLAAAVENFYPSWVFRCALHSSTQGAVPATVIVRIPREGTMRSGQTGLHNEQAALAYLTEIGSSLAPRLLAGSEAAGFLVTEDLGTDPSLLDLLLGNDPATARQATLTFARGLGRLHTQMAKPPNGQHDLPIMHTPIRKHWQQVRNAVVQIELPMPNATDGDVDMIVHFLTEPGGGLSLSSGDPSVVNVKIAGEHARFFDFEEACFRHPLIDASVLRYPYPTGGPPWQLPLEVTEAMESAYRTEVAPAFSFAQDDSRYEEGMAAACAAWTIVRLARLPKVDVGPDRDSWELVPPGWTALLPTRSRRRQLVAILETCIVSAHRADRFESFATWCEQLAAALRERWTEATEELPLYPAFGGKLPLPTG